MRYPLLIALCCVTAPAFAADLPTRKAGLWEVKINFARNAPQQTMQQCTDPTTDKMMTSSSGGMTNENCSKHDVVNSGNTYTMDSVCTAASGRTLISHAVVTGSFDSGYTMNITTKGEAPPQPGEMAELSMTLEAKYLGACKPDQKPGDIIMPGGLKLNVTDMQRMRQNQQGNAPAR